VRTSAAKDQAGSKRTNAAEIGNGPHFSGSQSKVLNAKKLSDIE
jgi:hypothetical protein